MHCPHRKKINEAVAKWLLLIIFKIFHRERERYLEMKASAFGKTDMAHGSSILTIPYHTNSEQLQFEVRISAVSSYSKHTLTFIISNKYTEHKQTQQYRYIN